VLARLDPGLPEQPDRGGAVVQQCGHLGQPEAARHRDQFGRVDGRLLSPSSFGHIGDASQVRDLGHRPPGPAGLGPWA